ncbi:helix-turn-helix domain-containing protein [Paenibacillus sp. GYB004]|uniref:helix-turn-helix domain-containing protein n=1 Tax=Paenibacillus sp. GYB004 TaxID=2994393 RepID=UPI002F962479
MNRLFSGRIALFWQLFASYFVLFLVPVFVASTVTYVFVVRLIESDAEARSDMLMRHYSDQTDSAFTLLQTSMIHMLSAADLKGFLKVAADPPDNQQRNEWVHSLMEQLNKLRSEDLVTNAYLYFAGYDLVIDSRMHTDKTYYFQYHYKISQTDKAALFPHLTGKKMMVFTKPYAVMQNPLNDVDSFPGSVISAVMSYPFNSANPDLYLVVDVNRDKLREKIGIGEPWVLGTAMVDRSGEAIVQAGSMEPGARANKLSSIPSRFTDAWSYVSVIDLQTLLAPARLISKLCVAFFGFFLLLGSAVSYLLSRKLYAPIHEIKTGLVSFRDPLHGYDFRRRGNDFDVIKRYSDQLMTENDQLSRLVTGMVPMVQEHLLTRLLLGEYRDGPLAASGTEMQRTVLCIELQAYSRKPEHGTEEEPEPPGASWIGAIAERIRKSYPGPVWLCQTKPDILACVVHHEAAERGSPDEAAQRLKVIVLPYAKVRRITIGIGSPADSWEQLHRSYGHALAMLEYKGLGPEVELCGEERMAQCRTGWDSLLSAQDVNRFVNMYKSRDYGGLLKSVFDLLDAGKLARAAEVKMFCSDVLSTWIRSAETDRGDFHIAFYSGLFDKLNRCVTWEEIRLCLRDIHAELFRPAEPYARCRQFAEIAVYIREHYNEELSIERFARQLNMSAGHFSRTFKEEVGDKYVEYIAKVRLEKAKQYLLETDMNIDEIAEKVGYWGRNSLIPVFRKYEGTTPAKYRAIHQR